MTDKQVRRAARERDLADRIRSLPAALKAWEPDRTREALYVGRAAEHLVCADALMRGYNAFQSSQGSPYDLILERDGRLFKVQVKGAQSARNVNSGGLTPRTAYSFAALRRGKSGQGPRLTSTEADIIACVALDRGVVAYLPVDDCSSTIQLEPERVAENNRVRTYTRPIGEYPLEEAVAQVVANKSGAEVSAIFPPFPARKYGVILADPPWSFGTYSENGMDRSADNHYPTVATDFLCGIGPFLPAAEDCALFLWATVPMLPQALDVMDAWGFAYKSSFAWVKNRIGTGYWGRNQHEILLVGTKGAVPAPAMGEQWSSVLHAPTGRHSEKPWAAYEMIEDYFPTLPKIELNARAARTGWDRWGLEAPPGRRKIV